MYYGTNVWGKVTPKNRGSWEKDVRFQPRSLLFRKKNKDESDNPAYPFGFGAHRFHLSSLNEGISCLIGFGGLSGVFLEKVGKIERV